MKPVSTITSPAVPLLVGAALLMVVASISAVSWGQVVCMRMMSTLLHSPPPLRRVACARSISISSLMVEIRRHTPPSVIWQT